MPSVLAQFLEEEPKIPKLKPINVGQVQQQTIAGNTAALPAATEFAGQVDQSNLDRWLKGIKFALPDFESIRSTVSQNIASMVRGEIPTSDRNQLLLRDAAKAYGGGYSGSGMHGALTARDLGRTELDIRLGGQNAFASWMKALDAPSPIDMSQMFLTATQGIDYAYKEREQQFQRDYVSNVTSAQYSFGSRTARSLDAVADAVISILGSYVSGGMGG